MKTGCRRRPRTAGEQGVSHLSEDIIREDPTVVIAEEVS